MSLDNLPVEWLTTSIENVADVKGGKRLPKGKVFAIEKTEYPYLRVTDMENGSVSLSDLRYIDKETHTQISNYFISKDDLYISIAGTIGLVGDIPYCLDGANLTENAAKICNLQGIDKRYLKYVLNSQIALDQFDEKVTSSGQPKLALFRIRDCSFPYPALAEQQEIVRQLDLMLAQVEQIKARLDAIPAILKKFRQSLLEDSFNNLEIIEDLENLVQPKRSISYGVLKPGDYCNEGVVLLRIKDILSNIDLESNDLHKISQDLSEQYKRTILHGKETLISLVGTVGRIGYVSDNLKGANVHRNLGVIAPNQDKIDSKFLNYQMQSEFIQSQIRHVTTGANQPLLNLGDVRKLNIRLTDIDSQKQIVEKIKLNIGLIAKIDDQLKSAQKRVNLLTQSILAKAFSGELTAEWREQHQDLITSVNSAEALLAKIQAEREANKPVKKTRKK